MEQQHLLWPITILLQQIINSNHINIMQTLFSFLGKEEIESIAATALNHKKSQFFFKIAIAQHLLNTFINKVDRTNYYLFYEDSEFKKIQQQHLLYLINQHFQTLVNSHHSFTQLQKTLEQELSICDEKEQLTAIFSSLFFDTELSLPKMKRQTIGMYCQSPLQDYISLLRFPQDQLEQPWIQQCITQLKQKTQEGLQQIIEYHPYPSSPLQQPSNTAHQKIRILRFCPFKIKHDNWKKFIIEGFVLHNLLVIIFAICSQLVKVYSFIIKENQDPFQQFTEFTLRANIYRNLIINLDEKLGFLFELYSRFYENVYYPPPDRPPFRFWQPAMSIWTQQMKTHHENNCKVFKYVATKMRESSLLEFLIEKTQKLPSFFTSLKDQIQMKIFSQSRKQQVYNSNQKKQQLQYFFQNNTELYQIISKDYLEYMIDISINEYSIHRCGHSQHIIQQNPIFKPFQQEMIKQSFLFYQFIKKILFQSSPQQLQLSFLKQVIKQDINILNIKLLKPVTLRQIINMFNNIVKTQIQQLPQYAVFGEEGISKYKIAWDFQEKDTLLDYFCGKYQILDCPENLIFYYNIQIDDIDQIEENNCEDQSFEYCQEYISQQQMQDQSQPHH